MNTQAPLWALAAEAIDGIGDTHLPGGIHVRALPSAKLGIPATPLVVTRGALTLSMIKELGRTDAVIWVDSRGATLTLPFSVTPDNPVYGYFPAPHVIFALLSAEPARRVPPVKEPPLTLPIVRNIRDVLPRPQPIATGALTPIAAVNLDHLRDALEATASAFAAATAG